MTRAVILNDDLKKSFLKDNPHILPILPVEHEMINFSGGEPHIKITENLDSFCINTSSVIFITKLRTPKDLIELAVAVNAIYNIGSGADFHLLLGYLPGGRQDRICISGEAFTAKVYAKLINGITDWDSITCLDAHSDVMPALLDNCINVDNKHFVDKAIEKLDLEDFTLISPDAGANKKVLSLAQHINNKDYGYDLTVDVVRADKLRDMKTGNILETIVYADDLTGQDCVIVDDICDGGRTFIELAKVLKAKGARNVILIVTHGIFSKGFGPVLQHVDQIVTTNSFIDLSQENEHDITIIGLNESFYNFK